jgi:ABC-2 type transport system ATP-binding protein
MVQLIQRQGRSILLSSHILADVERIADRVGVMVDGVLRVDCPTERFKQSVRKVIVEFAGATPEIPKLDGLIGQLRSGSRSELIVVGFDDGQRSLLESLEPRRLEVVELNLEDAFVEYTRGPRRSLPLVSEETLA